MDKIIIKNLEVELFIGIYEHEKKKKQKLFITTKILVKDMKKASHYDKINYALDYDKLSQKIIDELDGKQINLIETVAEKVAQICLANPLVIECKVSVAKPTAIKLAQEINVQIVRKSSF